MRVKFLESLSVSVEQVFYKGSVHDLPDGEAKRYIESEAAQVASDDDDVHTAVESMEGVKKAVKKRS